MAHAYIQILVILFCLSIVKGFLQSSQLNEVCEYVDEGYVLIEDARSNEEMMSMYSEYSIKWIVTIQGGQDAANEIARRNGFTNYGMIAKDGEVFLFVLNEEEFMNFPRDTLYDSKTKILLEEENVISAEQKMLDVQCAQTSKDVDLVRERRQSRADILGVYWFNPSTALLYWDHPIVGVPVNHYTLLHAGIIISNGSCSVDIATYENIASTATFYYPIISGISESDISIFHLIAEYDSSSYSSLYLHGGATLPAPVNVVVDILNNTSILVSWDPPTDGSYTYAVSLYDGSLVQCHNSLCATSRVIGDLTPEVTYLILVVAMQGNSYGASFLLYDFFPPAVPPEQPTITPLPTFPPVYVGDLRLVEGPNRCEGLLQVGATYNGQLQWTNACHRDFCKEEIQVACQQIGCPTGNPQRRAIESYGGRQHPGSVYQYFGYSCEGTEGKVVDCPYTGGVCDLQHNFDIIAIACLDGGTNVPPTDLTLPGSLSGDYPLRLEGGENSCQGDLEVFIPHLGEWALAVSEVFGDDEAAVVCCELGCGPPLNRHIAIRQSGPYLLVGYDCDGTENKLKHCSPIPLTTITPPFFINIECDPIKPPTPTSTNTPTPVSTNTPTPVSTNTPTPVSTNTPTTPPTAQEGDIRLVQGDNMCEGNLETAILFNGDLEWAETCDRAFGQEEAEVVCRQLGCSTNNAKRSHISEFGGRSGARVIQAFAFICVGSESNLDECTLTGAHCDVSQGSDFIAISCQE